jgi:uncharacterized Zn finger protein (UPF0148 family)
MSLHRLSRNSAQPAAGRDIEAHCTPCGMSMNHTILAMVGLEVVKVRCNTCGGEHKYKSTREAAAAAAGKARRTAASPAATKTTPKAAGSTKAGKAAADAKGAVRALYHRVMADRDRASAVMYGPGLEVRPGMLVDHKIFGYGIVDAVYEGKSRMLFEDGYKILATGR